MTRRAQHPGNAGGDRLTQETEETGAGQGGPRKPAAHAAPCTWAGRAPFPGQPRHGSPKRQPREGSPSAFARLPTGDAWATLLGDKGPGSHRRRPDGGRIRK